MTTVSECHDLTLLCATVRPMLALGVTTTWNRHVPVTQYGQAISEAFDELHRSGAESGRTLVLNLHPYMIGQPFRSKYLDQALAHISKHDGVWKATGREIIEWYKAQPR